MKYGTQLLDCLAVPLYLLRLVLDDEVHHPLEDVRWRLGDSTAPLVELQLRAVQRCARGFIASEDFHEKLEQAPAGAGLLKHGLSCAIANHPTSRGFPVKLRNAARKGAIQYP